jgi:hypothetical protein
MKCPKRTAQAFSPWVPGIVRSALKVAADGSGCRFDVPASSNCSPVLARLIESNTRRLNPPLRAPLSGRYRGMRQPRAEALGYDLWPLRGKISPTAQPINQVPNPVSTRLPPITNPNHFSLLTSHQSLLTTHTVVLRLDLRTPLYAPDTGRR